MPRNNIEALMRASQMMRRGVGLPSGVSGAISQQRIDPFEQREAEKRAFEREVQMQAEADQVAAEAAEEANLANLQSMMFDAATDPNAIAPPRPMVREMAEGYGAGPQESRGLAQMMRPPAGAVPTQAGLSPEDKANIPILISMASQGISPNMVGSGASPDPAAPLPKVGVEQLVSEMTNLMAASGDSPPAIAEAVALVRANYS